MYVLWFVFNVNRASIKLLTNLTCVCFIVIYRHATHSHTHRRRHTHMQRTYICRHTCSNKLAQIYHVCQLLPVLSLPLTPQAAEHLSRSTLHLAKIQAESACSGCGNGGSQILRSDAAGAAWGVRSLVGCEKAAAAATAAGIEPAIGGDWLPHAPSASRANHSLHSHAWAHPGAVACQAAWLGLAHDPKVEGGGWRGR